MDDGRTASREAHGRPGSRLGPALLPRDAVRLAPELLSILERALRRHYPSETFELAPFFQFGSWIGGDRDGNPFVTNDVTRRTMRENACGEPAITTATASSISRACCRSPSAPPYSCSRSARSWLNASRRCRTARRSTRAIQANPTGSSSTAMLRKLDADARAP